MRRYGRHGIFDNEDTSKCAVKVASKVYGRRKQCGNKRGYGPGGIYCRIHARMVAVGQHPGFGVPEEMK